MQKFVRANFKEATIEEDSRIGLLCYSARDGYYIKRCEIKASENLDLSTNYNDGFEEVHNKIIENITTLSKSMHILHSVPGCGKTTYLKYLLSVLAKKGLDVVYLPPNLSNLLASPDFISDADLLRGKVIFMEDAEEILINKGTRSQAINNILNISDGILSDVFNTHFIFTFNVDVTRIDSALLRKGRLTYKYEFKELAKDKIAALCDKLGVKVPESGTLAEIYNQEDNMLIHEDKGIGFK